MHSYVIYLTQELFLTKGKANWTQDTEGFHLTLQVSGTFF